MMSLKIFPSCLVINTACSIVFLSAGSVVGETPPTELETFQFQRSAPLLSPSNPIVPEREIIEFVNEELTNLQLISTVVSTASVEISVPLPCKASDLHIGQFNLPRTKKSAELVSSSHNFSAPITPSEQQPILNLPTWITEAEPNPLPTSRWEVSQSTVIPAAPSEPDTDSSSPNTQDTPVESPNTQEPQTTVSQSNQWHFLFQPYIYVPITIYGNTTFRRFRAENSSGDFALSPNQIRSAIKNKLNFAFFGDLQAWTPNYHLGFLANVDYLSTSNNSTFTRPVRRQGFADFIPSQLRTEVDTQVWSVDLATAYRFYNQSKVNPKGVSTEFDLGPFLFDIIGGLNIASVNADLDLSTNLGGQASFDGGTTVVSPLLGGRLQVNVAPKLALVTAGSVSGFGIDGLTNWRVRTGLDWMFSGNTSLGLGYRFGHLSYNKGFDNGRDFGVTVNNNGPYLSFSFRF